MFWSVVAHLAALLLDLVMARRQSEGAKDREIAVLRHQRRMPERRRPRPRLSRWERLTLALLATKLRHLTSAARQHLSRCLVLVEPETVLRWHRDLVRRKWTCRSGGRPGRRTTDATLEALILRLARENTHWGYARIHGELGKRGHTVGRSTIRAILRRHGVPPVPRRGQGSSTWRAFLARHTEQLLACDCFTVETLWLKTRHVVFFLEVGTRRVHRAGCTAHPTAAWVTQQARNLCWTFQDTGTPPRFLIHDRDAKFPASFDAVFATEGVAVVRTPYRSPTANAYAARWVRAARAACLDHLLVAGEGHLRRVLAAYVAHDNEARPHRGLTTVARRQARWPRPRVRCSGAMSWAASSTSTIATRRSRPLRERGSRRADHFFPWYRLRRRFPHTTPSRRPPMPSMAGRHPVAPERRGRMSSPPAAENAAHAAAPSATMRAYVRQRGAAGVA